MFLKPKVYAFVYALGKKPFERTSTAAYAAGLWKDKMKRKSNGAGHTYQVGKSYRTVIRHNGLIITAMAPTPQLSRQKAREKIALLPDNALEAIATFDLRTTLASYLVQWLEAEHKFHIAHSTYKRYDSLVRNHINPLIGSYELRKVTPRLITWMLGQMRLKGQSVRSQQQARAVLSIALRDAESQNYISHNPVAKVRNPQERCREISPLSLSDVKRLLDTYQGTHLAARLHIALLCGLRQGEALGLTWDDVDFVNRALTVRRQVQYIDGIQMFADLKTHRSKRVIALTEQTIHALREHQENFSHSDLIFEGPGGGFYSPKTDYCDWQRALKLCGIPKRPLHDARHTAATLMYSGGVGIETISRTLGHSTSAITSKTYVHSASAPLYEAAKSLEMLLI